MRNKKVKNIVKDKLIPDIDDPQLIFYDIEDSSVAYNPIIKTTWDVKSNKTLKIRTDYPNIEDISHFGKPLYGRVISKDEAIQISKENEELNVTVKKLLAVSEEALRNWIPSIDHPRLRFIEVEDIPIAYFPHKYLHWRVLYNGTLKKYDGWPNSADIFHNGCRISKENALILAEYWDAERNGKKVELRFEGNKTYLIYLENKN